MQASEVVGNILQEKKHEARDVGKAFAPSNIALCKYWGKRDKLLNLPMTSSLSIALPTKGTWTEVDLAEAQDEVILNGKVLSPSSSFYQRVMSFCHLFRPTKNIYYRINTKNNIPTAAGLASSASGYAALVKALDDLWQWNLDDDELSILARMGSGSACRSLWNGFVEWQAGSQSDGMDSFAKPFDMVWPGLCVGLLIFSQEKKPISSREAMNITVDTSSSYFDWPARVERDLPLIKKAIVLRDFMLLGQTAELNALAMHQTMLDAKPAIDYCLVQTQRAHQQVRQLREQGVAVYFTQDAGPNLKLLFEKKNCAIVTDAFPHMELIEVF